MNYPVVYKLSHTKLSDYFQLMLWVVVALLIQLFPRFIAPMLYSNIEIFNFFHWPLVWQKSLSKRNNYSMRKNRNFLWTGLDAVQSLAYDEICYKQDWYTLCNMLLGNIHNILRCNMNTKNVVSPQT